jgi:hypothetical protein
MDGMSPQLVGSIGDGDIEVSTYTQIRQVVSRLEIRGTSSTALHLIYHVSRTFCFSSPIHEPSD